MQRQTTFSALGRVLILASVALPGGLRAADVAPSTAPAAAPAADAAPLAQPATVSPATTASGDTMPQAPTPTMASATTYTVVKGDTLWKVAHHFHTSIRKLKALNHLTKDTLKPGQMLKIPAAKAASAAPVKTTGVKHHAAPDGVAATAAMSGSHYMRAQPVQDCDIPPASTFASCPVPVDNENDTPETAPSYVPATTETAKVPLAAAKPAATVSPENGGPMAASGGTPEYAIAAPAAEPAPVPSPAPVKPAHRGLFGFFSAGTAAPAVDWGTRFTQAARDLGDLGLEYDDAWRPPGESHAWAMDCSNTTRYLYKATTGIELPRTASDQYYYLHLQNKAWDVPQAANGFADCNYLRANLKPGDLLFWENTYRPERQPPITHVMVFLGTNERGEWLMAGSQSGRGGAHNRRHGGPDIYVFDPTRACGGYTTWMGLVHHQGRFCAYGRPLEADKSKLSVAAND